MGCHARDRRSGGGATFELSGPGGCEAMARPTTGTVSAVVFADSFKFFACPTAEVVSVLYHVNVNGQPASCAFASILRAAWPSSAGVMRFEHSGLRGLFLSSSSACVYPRSNGTRAGRGRPAGHRSCRLADLQSPACRRLDLTVRGWGAKGCATGRGGRQLRRGPEEEEEGNRSHWLPTAASGVPSWCVSRVIRARSRPAKPVGGLRGQRGYVRTRIARRFFSAKKEIPTSRVRMRYHTLVLIFVW